MTVDKCGHITDTFCTMNAIEHLLTLSRVYGVAEGIEPTTVSYRAFKDSKKLRALIGGATITISRAEAVVRWFSDNWPKDAGWPSDVPRPDPKAGTHPPTSLRVAPRLQSATHSTEEATT